MGNNREKRQRSGIREWTFLERRGRKKRGRTLLGFYCCCDLDPRKKKEKRFENGRCEQGIMKTISGFFYPLDDKIDFILEKKRCKKIIIMFLGRERRLNLIFMYNHFFLSYPLPHN